MRKVVFQQILALSTLELTIHRQASATMADRNQTKRLNSPPFRITSTIMPRYRTLLRLNMTSRRPLKKKVNSNQDQKHPNPKIKTTYLRIIPKYFLNLRHPTHIQTLGKIRPHSRSSFSKEATMLSRKSYILQMSQMFLQERTISSRDDVYQVLWIRRELFESFEGSF